jgi:hypothetical protein
MAGYVTTRGTCELRNAAVSNALLRSYCLLYLTCVSTTSLNLAQPNMSQEGALRNALMFEAERFSRSTSKVRELA